ncbi:MAG: DoxX family protein [Bacteroidales bacterium]
MKRNQQQFLVKGLAIFLGVYFLISSIAKAFDLGGFTIILEKYGIPGLSIFAPLILFFELGISLVFLLNVKTRIASIIAMCSLVVFTLAFLYSYTFHSNESCGCLGVLSSKSTSNTLFGLLLRNSFLFFISYIIYKKSYDKKDSIETWKYYFLIVPFILFAYLMGFTNRNKLEFNNVFVDKKNNFYFKGEAIDKTPFAIYNFKLKKNSVNMIFCFDYSCPFFWNSVANLMEYGNCKLVDTIILIGTDSHNEIMNFENAFNLKLNHSYLEPDVYNKSIGMSPCMYLIINDTIKHQIPGTLPAYQNIQKLLKAK